MPGTKREPTPYKQGSWADAVEMPQTAFNMPSQSHAQMPTGFGFPSQSAPIQPVVSHSQSHSSSYEDNLPEIPGYQIERKLAEGGMGAVYIVRQEGTGAIRAAKTIKAKSVDVEALERFRIEYESLGLINHPNVVRVHASGVHNNVPYLVMELVEGHELADELTEPWDSYYAAEISERILRALEAIHETGIIHRDIKPQNIFICDDDQPKIADFGLARVMQGEGLTKTGDILGTPAYMAPEQVVAVQSDINHQVDIWAVGVMLYQMISGVLPYEQRNAVGIMSEIALGSYPRIEDRVPDVDRNLAAIVSKAMARTQEMRYQSAADMADDLLKFIEGDTPEARQQRDQERYLRWAKRLLIIFGLFASRLFGMIYLQHKKNHVKQGQVISAELLAKVDRNFAGWRSQFQSKDELDLEQFTKELNKFKSQLKTQLTVFNDEYSDVVEASDNREKLKVYGTDLGALSKALKGQELELSQDLNKRPVTLSVLGDLYFFSAKAKLKEGLIEASGQQFDRAWRCYIHCFGRLKLSETEKKTSLKRALYAFIKARQYKMSFRVEEGLQFFNIGDLGFNSKGATFAVKLSLLNEIIDSDPELKKNLKTVRKAVAGGLYATLDHAFFTASKPENASKDTKDLVGHLDAALKLLMEWDLPVSKSYPHLEPRAAPCLSNIKALTERIVPVAFEMRQERQRGLDLLALAESKRLEESGKKSIGLDILNNMGFEPFVFWSQDRMNQYVLETRSLLNEIEQAYLLSYSRKNRKRLRELTAEYFERESFIFLRWEYRQDYIRALKLGLRVRKTMAEGSESFEWRLAEDLLMATNLRDDVLQDAEIKFKDSLKTLLRFMEKYYQQTPEQIKAQLDEEKKGEENQYAFKRRKRFLQQRLYGYLIRVQARLGDSDRAAQTLMDLEKRIADSNSQEELIERIKNNQAPNRISRRIGVVPNLEFLKSKLSKMPLSELDRVILKKVPELVEIEDSKSTHTMVFLISIYLEKLKRLSGDAQRKAFQASIKFEELENALTQYYFDRYFYENYDKWIHGLLDLSELYQRVGQSIKARSTLRCAQKFTDDRRHPYILELNQRIKNRIRQLDR